MAMQFHILGSSSSGNSALLTTDRCKILIDAGFSARRLNRLLADLGESLESIDAVFLTHEHQDHTAGLVGISRLPELKVFANHGTAQALDQKLKRRPHWKIFETGASFRVHDIEVTAFSVPHDAYDPVGFVFSQGGDDLFNPRRSVAWCVDLGYIPQLVRERVRDVEVLVLEANHEMSLLDDDTRRPWSVKQRIKGRHGHLSNEAAFSFLGSEPEARWRQIYLAHLSRDCNNVPLVESMIADQRQHLGKSSYAMTVVDPKQAPPPYEFTD